MLFPHFSVLSRDNLCMDEKMCTHVCSPSFLSTKGTHSYPVLQLPPSNTSRRSHHISFQLLPHSFFLFFSLSNCMHDDQGERVFVAITVLQDQWWLRTQRHVTDPWTHTVVLQSRSPTCFWWAYKPEWPLWKTVCQSPQRLNIHFSYDPALHPWAFTQEK